MKILIVSQMFWPEHFLVNQLASELVNRKNEVTVYTGLPNYPQGKLYNDYSILRGPWRQNYMGVDVIRSPLIPRGHGFLRLAINYISFVFFSIFGLFRFRKSNFDVSFVFATSPITVALPAIFLKLWKKTPLVIWVQDLWPESLLAVGAISESHFLYRVMKKCVVWIYKYCDVILIQSPKFQSKVEALLASPKPIYYVPNWSEKLMGPVQLTEWVSTLPQGFRLCFAGNIGRAQSIQTILKAAKILENEQQIKFIVVGDGSEFKFMRAQSKELGLKNIFFYGRKPSLDMPGLFMNCDALLVSLAKSEIFSLTIPSKIPVYMSSGKPIVAALDGIGADIIIEGNAGYVGPSEDFKKLAQNILEVYKTNDEKRMQMGRNAINYFKLHFEKSKVIDQIEQEFKKILFKKTKSDF